MNPGKATVDLMPIRYHMMAPLYHRQLLFAVFNKTAEHPEQGMNPEHCKRANQQRCHTDEGIKKNRIILPIGHLTVGVKFNKLCR